MLSQFAYSRLPRRVLSQAQAQTRHIHVSNVLYRYEVVIGDKPSGSSQKTRTSPNLKLREEIAQKQKLLRFHSEQKPVELKPPPPKLAPVEQIKPVEQPKPVEKPVLEKLKPVEKPLEKPEPIKPKPVVAEKPKPVAVEKPATVEKSKPVVNKAEPIKVKEQKSPPPKPEPTPAPKVEQKSTPKPEPVAPKVEQKSSPKPEPVQKTPLKPEVPKVEQKPTPKPEPIIAPKVEVKVAPKPQAAQPSPKVETSPPPKPKPVAVPKPEATPPPKPKPVATPKVEEKPVEKIKPVVAPKVEVSQPKPVVEEASKPSPPKVSVPEPKPAVEAAPKPSPPKVSKPTEAPKPVAQKFEFAFKHGEIVETKYVDQVGNVFWLEAQVEKVNETDGTYNLVVLNPITGDYRVKTLADFVPPEKLRKLEKKPEKKVPSYADLLARHKSAPKRPPPKLAPKTEKKAAAKPKVNSEEILAELMNVKGVGPATADALFKLGIHSIKQLAKSDPNLLSIRGAAGIVGHAQVEMNFRENKD